MRQKKKIIILIMLIGIISGVLPYWFNAYNNQSMVLGFPSVVFALIFMGTGAFLGSLILTLRLNEKHWKIALLINAGVIIGIMCGVFTDEESHTLFPFEIIMALFWTIPSAFIGSYLAQIFKYIKSK